MDYSSNSPSKRPSWDEFYLQLADFIATRSKDESTKIGAVIVKNEAVISVGYNDLPRGADEKPPERHERPTKYLYYEHGERNAIYNAARNGIATLGATMYTQGVPCADCARAVIQAGIRAIVVYHQTDNPRWKDSCLAGRAMLVEAGVEIVVKELPNA